MSDMGARLRRDRDVLLGGSVLFLLTMAGNVLNLAYAFLMARVLGQADYGALVALLSLLVVIGTPAGTIQTVVARHVAIADAREDGAGVRTIVVGLLRPLAVAALVATAGVALLAPWLVQFLRLRDPHMIHLMAPLIGGALVLPVLRGAAQGLHRFWLLGTVGLADVATKVALGVTLAWWGLGIQGAVAALGAGMVLSAALAWYGLAPHLLPLRQVHSQSLAEACQPQLRSAWRSVIPTLLALGGLYSMASMDAVLVKHYFAPEEAGPFAALAVAGRSLFWASTAVCLALLPIFTRRQAQGGGTSARRTLWWSVAIVITLCGVGEAGFVLFPTLVVRLLFGMSYLGVAPLLPWYGLAAASLAVACVLVNYLLAVGSRLVGVLTPVCAVGQVVLVALFHGNLERVVVALIAANASLLALSAVAALSPRHGPWDLADAWRWTETWRSKAAGIRASRC